MIDLPKGKHIVLFDGVCNLCNHWVQFIIERDKKDVFRFVALQSDLGKQIVTHLKIKPDVDSIILYQPGIAYYYKAEAVEQITVVLGGWVGFLSQLGGILPLFFKNSLYDYVAKNRYKWYGKKDQCMVPTPQLRNKFI